MATMIHVVKEGETLESIASLFYGDESFANILAEINDLSLVEVLAAGHELVVPEEVLSYQSLLQSSPREVVMEVKPRQAPFVQLEVRELVFPGTASDAVPLEGKWLYAVRDGQIDFSVEAMSPIEWRVSRKVAPGPELVRDGRLLLHAEGAYHFFLSPIPLSDEVQSRLVQNLGKCLWLTHVDQPGQLEGASRTVLVRDVLEWALDMHHKEYLPKLARWQEWLADPERVAKDFIASTLKTLLDQGDQASISGHLAPGEPKKYLAQQEQAEKDVRGPAEMAAFYVAKCVDSEDHRIVEAAHEALGQSGIELMVAHFAAVLGDMAQTFEGRQLLDVIAGDTERVPRKYLFTETPATPVEFGHGRYSTLAVRALLKDLGPAVLAYLYPKQTKTAREKVAIFLKQWGEEKPLIGTYRQAEKNLRQGRKLSHKMKNRRALDKLVKAADGADEVAYRASLPEGLVRSKRLSEAYGRNLGRLDTRLMFALESINLALALRELLNERSATPTGERLVSVLGASADLSVILVETTEQLFKNGTRKITGVLGVVSGICDMVAFVQAARRASSKYDYDQAFANGVAAAGAGSIAVGSGLVLSGVASAVSASAGGTAAAASAASALALGGVFCAVGAGLVAAGVVWALLASDNAYQQFANTCFLGRHADGKPEVYGWSPIRLPALKGGGSTEPGSRQRELVDEAAALITLLSSFEVEFTGTSLVLRPGFDCAGVFEIYAEVHILNWEHNAALIEVDLDAHEVVQVRGLHRLAAKPSAFSVDAEGRVTQVEIDLRNAERPSFPPVLQYVGGVARARLSFASGKQTWYVPPLPADGAPQEPWVEVSMLHGSLINNYRGASSDSALHVDASTKPFKPGMKEFHD